MCAAHTRAASGEPLDDCVTGRSAGYLLWQSAGMLLGLVHVNMGSMSRPEGLAAAARAAEAAGFDSVWAGEHIVLPDPQVPPSPMNPQDPALDSLFALDVGGSPHDHDQVGDRNRDLAAAKSRRARQGGGDVRTSCPAGG